MPSATVNLTARIVAALALPRCGHCTYAERTAIAASLVAAMKGPRNRVLCRDFVRELDTRLPMEGRSFPTSRDYFSFAAIFGMGPVRVVGVVYDNDDDSKPYSDEMIIDHATERMVGLQQEGILTGDAAVGLHVYLVEA